MSRIMALLLDGAGLRLLERCPLRVKAVDFVASLACGRMEAAIRRAVIV